MTAVRADSMMSDLPLIATETLPAVDTVQVGTRSESALISSCSPSISSRPFVALCLYCRQVNRMRSKTGKTGEGQGDLRLRFRLRASALILTMLFADQAAFGVTLTNDLSEGLIAHWPLIGSPARDLTTN